MKRCLALIVLCSCISLPAIAAADALTFDVDLSGTEMDGDFLRVFGTITLDPDMEVGSAVVDSLLQLQYNEDPLITLPGIPQTEGDAAASLDWRVEGRDLFIDRVTNDNAILIWTRLDLPGVLPYIQFGSGPNAHEIGYLNSNTGGIGVIDLLPAGGPDVGTGFLVGTAVIPEPTSAAVMMALASATLVRRRRSAGS